MIIRRKIRLFLLLFFTCLISSTHGHSELEKRIFILNQYEKQLKWILEPLGEVSKCFIQLFVGSVTFATSVKESMLGKGGFFNTIICNTFKYNILFTMLVVIDVIIALLLLFVPIYLIVKKCYRSPLPVKLSICCMSTFFFICSICVIFAALLLCYASLRVHGVFPIASQYAEFVIQMLYEWENILKNAFQYKLKKVSNSAMEIVRLLFDINDRVSESFQESMGPVIQPIILLITSIEWDIQQSIHAMKEQRFQLQNSLSEVNQTLKSHHNDYNTALKRLNESMKGTAPDSLLELKEFESTYDASNVFTEAIQKLEAVKGVSDLREEILNVKRQLTKITLDFLYDPKPLRDTLMSLVFDVESRLRRVTDEYLAHIEACLKSSEKNQLLADIKSFKDDTNSYISTIHYAIMIFGILSIVLTLVAMIVYCSLLCKSANTLSNENISQEQCNIPCAKMFFTTCISLSVVMFFFWSSNVYLFVVSSQVVQFCNSIQDKSFFREVVDSEAFSDTPKWFRVFTTEEFNMTMTSSLDECQINSTYFPLLKKSVIEDEEIQNIKSKLDFKDATTKFKKKMEQVLSQNLSSADISMNMGDVMEKIDVSTPFIELDEYLSKIDSLKKELKNIAQKKSFSEPAKAALNILNQISTNISHYTGLKPVYSKFKTFLNITVETVSKESKFLTWTYSELNKELWGKSEEMYRNALTKNVDIFIDSLQLSLNVSSKGFEHSLNICRLLTVFYDKTRTLVCTVLTHPLTVAFFASILLAVFLFLVVVFSIPGANMYLKKESSRSNPETKNEDNGQALQENPSNVQQTNSEDIEKSK